MQSGQNLVSADVLEKLEEPVMPIIDHPALMPLIQQFQQLQLQKQSDKIPDVPQQFPSQQFGNHSNTSTQNLQSQQQPPSMHWTSNGQNAPEMSTSHSTEADDFDDFVAAPMPASINSALPSQAEFSQFQNIHNLSQQPIASSQQPTIPPMSHKSAPHIESAAPQTKSNSPTIDRLMNLPKVGCSPHNSPALSCDNSADDDFDDFQSATSETPGMISSDGSPRSAHHPLGEDPKLPSNLTKEKQASNRNTDFSWKAFGDTTSDAKSNVAPVTNQPQLNSKASEDQGLQLLKPNKVPDSNDKYAALRVMENIDSDLQNDFNSALPETDDSFGDFCSASKTENQKNNTFGDFSSVQPGREGNVQSIQNQDANTICDFPTDFSSLSVSGILENTESSVSSLPPSVNATETSNENSFADFAAVNGPNSLPNVGSTVSQKDSPKPVSTGPSDWSDIFGVLHDKTPVVSAVSSSVNSSVSSLLNNVSSLINTASTSSMLNTTSNSLFTSTSNSSIAAPPKMLPQMSNLPPFVVSALTVEYF